MRIELKPWGDFEMRLSNSAKWPWSHLKRHEYSDGHVTHIVWGKLSLVHGTPGLAEIEVCPHCLEQASHGYDGVSYCESCCLVIEGESLHMTGKEWENYENI